MARAPEKSRHQSFSSQYIHGTRRAKNRENHIRHRQKTLSEKIQLTKTTASDKVGGTARVAGQAEHRRLMIIYSIKYNGWILCDDIVNGPGRTILNKITEQHASKRKLNLTMYNNVLNQRMFIIKWPSERTKHGWQTRHNNCGVVDGVIGYKWQ